jgi:DNA-directed RNA polymerase specialized sigma subunit
MEKFCKMKNWDFLKFKTCYEKKLSRVKFRKEKLAMLMNMYTRRIYSEVEAKEEIRKHKKTICEKYNKEYKILSQREISKIFGISRYRLRRLNSQTALFLREKIESQFSFNNPSEISRAA